MDDHLTRRHFLQGTLAGGATTLASAFYPMNGGNMMNVPNNQQIPADFYNMESLNLLEQALPFAGIPTFMKMPYSRDPEVLGRADLVVMGIPFDCGTSNRSGTRMGPRAIREQSFYASAFQPIYPWTDDITQTKRIIDFGDIVALPGTGVVEMMLASTEFAASEIFKAGARLLSLGGDHTLPYGPIRAASKKFGKVALIHIDSHQDSYDSEELGLGISFINHGTFATGLVNEGHIDVSQSSQVYIRTIQPPSPNGGYNIIYANDALAMGPEALAERVRSRIGANTPVYITLDVDALDPAFAPGTGSPVAGGPTTHEMRRFLKALDGLNVVGADVVEVNPLYDPTQATAIVGATLAIDLLYLMAHAPK
ncbi:MAG: arginase family protein [Anaerolineae bacterium]|nr:arginase family protein [Anaerolineae bacterium]